MIGGGNQDSGDVFSCQSGGDCLKGVYETIS